MKKLITFIILLTVSAAAFGQEPVEQKWTVRASAGYLPTVPTFTSIFGAIFVGVVVAANKDNNETLDMNIHPYYGLEALYSFNSRWSLGLGTGYTGSVWNVVNNDTGEVHSSSKTHIVPVNLVGRLNYLNHETVKLYGSLEAGAMLAIGDSVSLGFDAQVNPIGVEFGRRFFGMAELGIGMNYFGGRIGIGYRF